MYTHVYSCTPMHKHVYACSLMYTHAYTQSPSLTPMCTHVHPCTVVHPCTTVYPHIPMYTYANYHVNPHKCMHTLCKPFTHLHTVAILQNAIVYKSTILHKTFED